MAGPAASTARQAAAPGELSDDPSPAQLPTAGRPVDAAEFRTVLGHFASGVIVLAAQSDEGPVGMSCQSMFSLSLEPPLIAISPSRTSKTWPHIRAAGKFAASILTQEQEALCRNFAVSGGDKFAGIAWRPSEVTGSPVIADALAWIDCTIGPIYEAGDHYLVIGEVADLSSAQGQPLLFYRGGFGTFQV